MNIREWFKLEPNYEETEVHITINRMLNLCRDALSKYFSIPDSKNINDLIQRAYEKNNDLLDEGFLEWLLEKGLPRLNNINFSTLPNEKKFVAMIEIDEFVLQNEMDFADPEEVRGCIISFANSLSEYISSYNEVSASIEEDISVQVASGDFSIDDVYTFDEFISQTSNWGSAEQVPFFMEELIYENA
ncbi:hypothetical protein [Bacillus halotolerans]|uniref:hypothetical protein n=1 Tax=Bacillus halotolerans TaxID=260554 RepID=UPI002DB5D12B|nr:hypothetical protein [Bacillus halotolerans]MEC1647469.1 hypothetical protein [Bacillus halotolerans]